MLPSVITCSLELGSEQSHCVLECRAFDLLFDEALVEHKEEKRG